MVGPRCFLFGPIKKFSSQNGEKIGLLNGRKCPYALAHCLCHFFFLFLSWHVAFANFFFSFPGHVASANFLFLFLSWACCLSQFFFLFSFPFLDIAFFLFSFSCLTRHDFYFFNKLDDCFFFLGHFYVLIDHHFLTRVHE